MIPPAPHTEGSLPTRTLPYLHDARILLVTPPRGLTSILRRHPGTAALRIDQCSGIPEALDAVEAKKADVILYRFPSRAQAVRLLDSLAELESDVCVILVGKDLGAHETAQLLQKGAFDYLTLPIDAHQVFDTIRRGISNREVFIYVRNLSSDLAHTNAVLARERTLLKQWNGKLVALNHLTQALAGSLEIEAIMRMLFERLPSIVSADLVGVVRNNPNQIWTKAYSLDNQAELTLRGALQRQINEQDGPREAPALQRRLHLVPPAGHSTPHDDPGFSLMRAGGGYRGIDVPLVIGSQTLGFLHAARREPEMFTEQEIQLLATACASLALTLRNADAHQHLQDLALRDPLTGVLNRRALDAPLRRELRAGVRYGTPSCLLLLDLDFFKTVNDVLGHVAGDDVLRKVAGLVRETVRDIDSVGRYGGEEFAVILPHTGLEQAQALAERIRTIIERNAFDLDDSQVRLTASIGVASMRAPDITTVSDWISAADTALYAAKLQGRNRVVVHTPGFSAPARAAAMGVAA